MPPLLAIVGETASGKSALAIDLAKEFNGEIICADSWTVYRGFDIGTAKPTKQERREVVHHLLDVADPAVGFSAVVFQRMAKRVINDIVDRGKLPIMVGGTGLYIDSVLYDYSFLPPSDPRLRDELNAMTIEQLLSRAGESKLDLTGIDTRNKRRVIRLIENNGVRPQKHELRSNTLILGLTVTSDQLRSQIVSRVDAMMEKGLEFEVRRLANIYGWDVEPMKGIGYREWYQYFKNHQSLAETRSQIINATMLLAKKQRTWFKRNDSIQWLRDRGYVEDFLTTFLNKTD